MAGCRCLPCRAANTNYETERAALRRDGLSNRIVSAGRARRHLVWLSSVGVGRRAVARASGIGATVLHGIKTGRRRRCRQDTARAVLSVNAWALSPGVYIDARPTWERIRQLMAAGWSKAAIARATGHKTPALQTGRERCTKRNADQVAGLPARMTGRP